VPLTRSTSLPKAVLHIRDRPELYAACRCGIDGVFSNLIAHADNLEFIECCPCPVEKAHAWEAACHCCTERQSPKKAVRLIKPSCPLVAAGLSTAACPAEADVTKATYDKLRRVNAPAEERRQDLVYDAGLSPQYAGSPLPADFALVTRSRHRACTRRRGPIARPWRQCTRAIGESKREVFACASWISSINGDQHALWHRYLASRLESSRWR